MNAYRSALIENIHGMMSGLDSEMKAALVLSAHARQAYEAAKHKSETARWTEAAEAMANFLRKLNGKAVKP